MYWHRFISYILKNRVQGLLLTFILSIIPVFGVVGILLAALVTLTKGIVEGALFTLAATLPYLLGLLDTHAVVLSIPPQMLWIGIAFAVCSNILTWIFAVMLRQRASMSAVLQTGALAAVLLISIVHLAYPNIAEWWGQLLQLSFQQAKGLSHAANLPPVPLTEIQQQAINLTKYQASGFMAAAILLNALFQLLIARWWQYRLFKGETLAVQLHQVRLSPLTGLLFSVSLVFVYLNNSVVLDVMPVVGLLFACAGLSIVHYFLAMMRSPIRWFWLTLFYIVFFFSMPLSIFSMAMVALFDIWLDLRSRFTKINS